MSLGPTYSPTVPVGGAASYKLTYSNGYWEVYRRFHRDFCGLGEEVEGGLRRSIFPWRNLSWGKRISMKVFFN